MDTKNQKYFLGSATVEAGNGGIARVARMMARSLHQTGGDVSLVSLLDKHDIDVHGVTSSTAKGSRLSFAVRCHLAEFSQTNFIYDSIGPARAHSRIPFLNSPYSLWIHGVEVWRDIPPHRMRVIDNAKCVFVNSQFTLDRFEELHKPLPHARVCWLATEEDEPATQCADFKGPSKVVVLGRIEDNGFAKGHKALVECWKHVVEQLPDARLVIAGGGDGLDKLRLLAEQSPAKNNIDILGRIEESAIPILLQSAHLFAMPSRVEGFGLVYVEAMRHGLPIITSIHDAGQEVNEDGETGFSINMDVEGTIEVAITRILLSDKLKVEMGQASIKRWNKHFRFSSFKDRFIGALQEI